MDPAVKRQALRLLTYGLYVVTARADGELAAGTVNWLTQCSFAPPLVAVGVKEDSHLGPLISRAGAFAVNILGADQRGLAQDFFRPTRLEDGRLNGHAFAPGPATGAPVLEEVPAWFEARVVETVRRGDHALVVGEVVEAGVRDGSARPLEMWDTGWFYGG
jgi:flavin reductase (DIM6/NTAB) family NADH-FMN oxidoreductase RutF